MPQVSLYMDQSILEKARNKAQSLSTSLSRYVTSAVSSDLENDGKGMWPSGYWDLFGSIQDETFVASPDMPIDQMEEKVLFP